MKERNMFIKMKSIEELWKEDKNRCFHKIVQLAGAEAHTREECNNCQGYACYEAEGDVLIGCTDYIRATKLEFYKNAT